MNCSDCRFEDALRTLRDQPGGHSGENIAGTARCHARVAGRIDPDGSVGMRDERAMSLEHDDDLMVAGKRTGEVDAVTLHRRDGGTDQARHFSGMGRDHETSSAAIELLSAALEGIEAVSIEHDGGGGFLHDVTHELRSFRMTGDS